MTWLRRVLTWRPGRRGHWCGCGSCQIGLELEKKLAAYRARMSYLNQPVREALPLEPHERDDELAQLEEGWR